MALVTKKVLLMLNPESTPPGRLIMHSKDLDYIKSAGNAINIYKEAIQSTLIFGLSDLKFSIRSRKNTG